MTYDEGMKQNHFDLIVIGAGSGGLTAAETAAKLGARVAMIESQPSLGGECLHSGCVPSKALIHAARAFWQSGHSQNIGVEAQPRLNFEAVMKHVNASINAIEASHDNDKFYKALGVRVVHGKAAFTSPTSIVVGGDQYTAKKFIIATGSSPAVPAIDGLQDGSFLTNESIFKLSALPESLAVIGGGPIGCELGQAFAMLGCKVTIIQSGERLLPHDEAEAAQLLLQSVESQGVTVRFNSTIEHVSYSDKAVQVVLKDAKPVYAQQLLVATGRRARLPDGLELAQVTTSKRGIVVNNRLQSSNHRIYAIGDCNGGLQFTHAAAEQGGVAVQNALIGTRKHFDSASIPWTTFTTPEIAHVGPTREQLEVSKTTYQVHRQSFEHIDKAVAESESGYVEVLTDSSDNVLACTIVGANAAEVMARINTSMKLQDLSQHVQAYPTYALGVRQMAIDSRLQTLGTSFVGRLLGRYIRFRR